MSLQSPQRLRATSGVNTRSPIAHRSSQLQASIARYASGPGQRKEMNWLCERVKATPPNLHLRANTTLPKKSALERSCLARLTLSAQAIQSVCTDYFLE